MKSKRRNTTTDEMTGQQEGKPVFPESVRVEIVEILAEALLADLKDNQDVRKIIVGSGSETHKHHQPHSQKGGNSMK